MGCHNWRVHDGGCRALPGARGSATERVHSISFRLFGREVVRSIEQTKLQAERRAKLHARPLLIAPRPHYMTQLGAPWWDFGRARGISARSVSSNEAELNRRW